MAGQDGVETVRLSLSQRKDVTGLEPEGHKEPFSASNGQKFKGAGESRTWGLDHPGFRVQALVLPNELCGPRQVSQPL